MMLFTIFILVGVTNMVFSNPNIIVEGTASSFNAANQICSVQGSMLLSTENYKMKYFIDFLKDNDLNSAWLNARLKKLPEWTFTDENNTQWQENIEQSADSGDCGAIFYGNKFKAFSCNKSLHALKQDAKGDLAAYKGQEKFRWHNLDKGMLATPINKPFERFEAYSKKLKDLGYPPPNESWIGLRKFDFFWQYETESAIPLRGHEWEDASMYNGECLLLNKNGKFVVVDCESDQSYPFLCIPGVGGVTTMEATTDKSSPVKEAEQGTIIWLVPVLVVGGVAVLVTCIVIFKYRKKCRSNMLNNVQGQTDNIPSDNHDTVKHEEPDIPVNQEDPQGGVNAK